MVLGYDDWDEEIVLVFFVVMVVGGVDEFDWNVGIDGFYDGLV